MEALQGDCEEPGLSSPTFEARLEIFQCRGNGEMGLGGTLVKKDSEQQARENNIMILLIDTKKTARYIAISIHDDKT